MNSLKRRRAQGLGLLLLLLIPLSAAAQRDNTSCGSLRNGYGPWDYTNPSHFRNKLPVVTAHHFTPRVERLISGQSDRVYSDLDYTLRAFPNHYRALNVMARYQRMDPAPANRGDIYTTGCYFNRAIRFKDDATVRMLFGMHLQLSGKLASAREQYEIALKFDTQAPELHYNYGLLLTELEEYEKARKHAQIAYEAGYPLPGLRNRLRTANQWQQ